jgi:hypothetical protein
MTRQSLSRAGVAVIRRQSGDDLIRTGPGCPTGDHRLHAGGEGPGAGASSPVVSTLLEPVLGAEKKKTAR